MAHSGGKWIEWPHLRLRFELTVERGVPVRFVYRLEYDHGAGSDTTSDWRQVARMDHDATGPHDVREEGLPLDVYDRRGQKVAQLRDFPRVPIREAPDYCEPYLERNAAYLVSNYLDGWDRENLRLVGRNPREFFRMWHLGVRLEPSDRLVGRHRQQTRRPRRLPLGRFGHAVFGFTVGHARVQVVCRSTSGSGAADTGVGSGDVSVGGGFQLGDAVGVEIESLRECVGIGDGQRPDGGDARGGQRPFRLRVHPR